MNSNMKYKLMVKVNELTDLQTKELKKLYCKQNLEWEFEDHSITPEKVTFEMLERRYFHEKEEFNVWEVYCREKGLPYVFLPDEFKAGVFFYLESLKGYVWNPKKYKLGVCPDENVLEWIKEVYGTDDVAFDYLPHRLEVFVNGNRVSKN